MTRYEAIAHEAGVVLCQERACAWKKEHGVAHFPRERYTSAGAFNLMLLAYHAIHSDESVNIRRWDERWRRVRWVNMLSCKSGVRIPRKMWDLDRAYIREDISRYKRRVAIRSRSTNAEMAAAERWATR